jgi:hypothetical protein
MDDILRKVSIINLVNFIIKFTHNTASQTTHLNTQTNKDTIFYAACHRVYTYLYRNYLYWRVASQ